MCSEDEFAALAESELEALPGWIKSAIATHNVAISIEDQRPNEPLTLGMFAEYNGASEITLYRLPINRIAVDRNHLRRAIHDTLLHELGHLFGMTETDLDHYSIGNTRSRTPNRCTPRQARRGQRTSSGHRDRLLRVDERHRDDRGRARAPTRVSTSSRVPPAARSAGTQE